MSGAPYWRPTAARPGGRQDPIPRRCAFFRCRSLDSEKVIDGPRWPNCCKEGSRDRSPDAIYFAPQCDIDQMPSYLCTAGILLAQKRLSKGSFTSGRKAKTARLLEVTRRNCCCLRQSGDQSSTCGRKVRLIKSACVSDLSLTFFLHDPGVLR